MRKLLALALMGATAVLVLAWARSPDPPWQKWVDRVHYPLRYKEIVKGHARNYRLEPALVAAVIYQESRFRPTVRSKTGAVGLMQLMPTTAKGIAARTGGTQFHVDDLLDPELNVRYGSWYLRYLIDRYGDEKTALAAYNAGQSNVDAWRADGGGIRFPETRHYVSRVEHLKKVYRRTYASDLGYGN